MEYQKLSKRQLLAMTWWNRPRFKDYDGIICDGSVRSGKTVCMADGFILWSMASFDGENFGICGKTIESLRRNVILNLRDWIGGVVDIVEKRVENKLIISDGKHTNTYFLFGGRDESSYTLVQGITLAGALLDEVALMPRSFVEQVIARCSVDGSKLWFNCNPEGPGHWFYQDWIRKTKERGVLHLHFTMDDNPALSQSIRDRYARMYSGIFYKRYVLGQWVISDGAIYDMFDEAKNVYGDDKRPIDLEWTGQRTIAIDYGTTNPMRFLDIYDYDGTLYVDREYSWDSRKEGRQKTDSEYGDDLERFAGKEACTIIVDPSSASFIAELRRRDFYVLPANNEVLDGIRKTSTLIAKQKIMIHNSCACLLEEMGAYVWDDKSITRGVDKPRKEMDHSQDALRYMVNSLPDWRFEV